MNVDAVVIGSGISGMTAAILMAQNGSRVVLLERSPQLAPVIRGFSHSGLYFDTGFHYAGAMGDGEILDLFFRYLGIADGLEVKPYDPEGFDLFRDPKTGRDFAFPCGFERIRDHFGHYFPQEREAIGRYLDAIRAECERLPYLNLDAPFDPQRLMNGLQGPSVQQVLDSLTTDRKLKQLLCLHGLLYGVPAEEMPFMLHASVVAPYFTSTWGFAGGGKQLVDAYEKRLQELGVDIRTGSSAERIELTQDGKVAAVHTADGERIGCLQCIATVAPRVMLDLVPENAFRPAYRKRLRSLEETGSAHLLFAGCEDSSLLEGRNLFVDGECDPFVGLGTTPIEERTLYLARAHAASPEQETNGLVVICPADPAETAEWQGSRRGQRPEGYTTFKQQTMERMQKKVETNCPELGRLTPVAGATPLTVQDYSGNPGGGLYGVKHKVGQYNPQPATRISGLLLAGQGTAAPGLLGATLSAFLCCGHLLGHDKLRNGVKQCS